MASVYRLYDRDFNVMDKVLVYGRDFKENRVEDVLKDADSTLSFECLGDYVPEEIEVEGYIETEDQIYVIKEINEKSVVCRLNLEDLEAWVIDKYTAAEQQNIVYAAEAALAGTGWTVISTVDAGKKRNVQQFKKTPLEILFKIRDAWMCEIRFDTKSKVVAFADEFGTDQGAYFIDGLNLKTARRTVDGYDFYTMIYPVGKDGLTIASVNDGSPYLENHQYSDKNIMLTWEDTSYEDPQALKDDAEAKLEDLSRPKVSYSADIRDLQKINAKNVHYLEDELGETLEDELGFYLTDQDEYSIFALALGDTVKLISKAKHIRDRQRIVKMVTYPDDPERSTVEMANTILTWEEMQERMKAAADAWEDISNADGSVNGVYVHGVQAGEVVGIEVMINGVPVTEDFDLSTINVNGTSDSLIALLNRSGDETEDTEDTEESTQQANILMRSGIKRMSPQATRSGETGSDENAVNEFNKLKAKVIDVDDLFAQNITATGKIEGGEFVGGELKSADYSKTSGASVPYADTGMQVDLSGKDIRSPDFAIVDGKMYVKGGKIGGWDISGQTIEIEITRSIDQPDDEIKTLIIDSSGPRIFVSYENPYAPGNDKTAVIEGGEVSTSSGSGNTRMYGKTLQCKSNAIAGGVEHTSSVDPEHIMECDSYLSAKYAPVSSSDPIMKDDIGDAALEDAEAVIRSLPLHSFRWKKDGSYWPVGFIAPELYEIDRNLASPPKEEEAGSHWTVDTFYLVGILTKAVQELSARADSQEARIRLLEKIIGGNT